MEGWFRVYRRLMEDPLWTREPFTRGQAWVDLIGLANHADGYIRVRGNRVDLKRGDVGWSEVSLAARWKWSRGKARRFFDELKTDTRIIQQKTFISSVITITNYDLYQGNDTADKTADGQQTIQQTDSRRYSRQYTNKNDKNEKNEKNEKDPPTPKGGVEDRFDRFYQAYPRKEAKQAALRAFKKLKVTEDLLVIMLTAVEQQKHSEQWSKDGGQFIPLPASWLNAGRWTDVVTASSPKKETPEELLARLEAKGLIYEVKP